MLHPPDHAALLARRDFVIPPGDFTPSERELLTRFGRWLEALARGTISPTTDAQEQFIAVVWGDRAPETDFERIWMKVIQQRSVGDRVTQQFEKLARARAEKAAVEAAYRDARAAVLAQVRDQLDAIDEQYAARLEDATQAANVAEQDVRDLTMQLGRSVWIGPVRATYSSPRVTWDTKQLVAFSQRHPEVLAFRKIGKPIVALRFVEKTKEAGPDVQQHESHEGDEPAPEEAR